MRPSIYWIEGNWPGRLAIAPRPRGGDWLEDELRDLRSSGIDIVVSLLADSEVNELNLNDEGSLSRTLRLTWYHLPLPDRGIPEAESQTVELVDHLVSALRQGKNVVIHCRQGIGRASLISGRVLMALGVDAESAIKRMTEARGLPVPETAAQRRWLVNSDLQFAPHSITST